MFTLKTVIFSIFRWYFRNFVGTNDILAGSHVPTKLRKSIIGGGGGGQWVEILPGFARETDYT